MPKKKRATRKDSKPSKQDDAKAFAFLAVFLLIIGYIVVILTKNDNQYVKFYAKQGIVLTVMWVIAMALGWIPIIGWAYWILILILWILAWARALSGKKKDTWLVSYFANKFDI